VFLGLAVIGVMAGGVWFTKKRPLGDTAKLPDGYVSTISAFQQEYGHYYGNLEDFAKVEGRFRSAADLAAKKNFPAVASVLESLSKAAALPVVFHNLGVAHAGLSDWARAADAFREALARDQEYAPTRKLLRETRGIPAGVAEPYTREHEPNESNLSANVIALRAPVGGEISGGNDSADYYRVAAPAAPRDLIAIDVASHSPGFAPRVRVYDDKFKIQSWGEKAARAGESLKLMGGPAPNSSLYISVSDDSGNGGLYLLTVTPQKAFDRFEPNDDVMASRRISIGEEVSANIMDNSDSDFFSFASPRKGAITVEIRNRAAAFVPVLAVYNKDRRNIGFAQDVKAGSSIRHTIEADKDQIYYLQISSQAGTAGAYILRVD
jgi:hypothetical protein